MMENTLELLTKLQEAASHIGEVIAKLTALLPQDAPAFAQAQAFKNLVAAGQTGSPTGTVPGVRPISPALLADTFALVEKENRRVCAILLNSRDYADIRKFCLDVLTIESRVTFLRQGIMGIVWGATVFVMPEIPIGTVYALGEWCGDEGIASPQVFATLQMAK